MRGAAEEKERREIRPFFIRRSGGLYGRKEKRNGGSSTCVRPVISERGALPPYLKGAPYM